MLLGLFPDRQFRFALNFCLRICVEAVLRKVEQKEEGVYFVYYAVTRVMRCADEGGRKLRTVLRRSFDESAAVLLVRDEGPGPRATPPAAVRVV